MPLPQNTLAALLVDEGAFATTLLCILVDKYGTKPISDPENGGDAWLAETIAMQIEEDFGVEIPKANLDKLMVAIDLITSDSFYKSLPDFVNWCNILSGDEFDPNLWDPADSSEIAWGITEALIIEPPEEEEPFNDEIRAYIGAVLDAEAIIHPPDVLRIALRMTNVAAKVSGEFSDDPVMFESIYKLESGKTEAINDYVKSNLRALAQQLESLPLSVGNTADVVKRVLQALA